MGEGMTSPSSMTQKLEAARANLNQAHLHRISSPR